MIDYLFINKEVVQETYPVVGKAFGGVKVKNKKKSSSFKCHRFVIFVFARDMARISCQPTVFRLQTIRIFEAITN